MSNMHSNNTEKSLNDCGTIPLQNTQNIDPVTKLCEDSGEASQKRVPQNPKIDWIEDPSQQKLGVQFLGQSGLCDNAQTGEIINSTDTPSREVVYRYSRALRGANEAMFDVFRNLQILDEEGKSHLCPLIFGTQEKAVGYILQDNIRKDNSTVVDRIRLPIASLTNNGYALDMERYTYHRAISLLPTFGNPGFPFQEKTPCDTIYGMSRGLPVNITYNLYVWTLYHEDMDQILEQVMLRFSPVAYLRIKGVRWEVIVTLDSMQNNFDFEPGDQKLRVLKYQFTMTAKSYIPQPIFRLKTPLENPFDQFTESEMNLLKNISENIQE